MNGPHDPNDPHDSPESVAGRRRITTLVAWMVALIGISPLYGVLYQVLPDYVGGGRPTAGQGQRQAPADAGQSGQVAGTAAPAAGPGASAPPAAPVRQSTDFVPKEADWSRALHQGGDDAARRGATIASSGNGAGAVACVSCHAGAPAGQGAAPAAPAGAFPTLAGMPADYVAKQLFDYRQDRRGDPVMGPIAKALKDDEIAAVARYYAGLPAPDVMLAQGGDSPAQKLHALGDNARALPACANCHGVNGEGQGFLLPRLAGQPADYLVKQFDAFRTGARHNDGDGAMRGIAQRLGVDDVRALGRFYAGQGQR